MATGFGSWVTTTPLGLNIVSNTGGSFTVPYTPVTTGELVGSYNGLQNAGILVLRAGAGVYDVGIQGKITTGSLQLLNRSLRVWTKAF